VLLETNEHIHETRERERSGETTIEQKSAELVFCRPTSLLVPARFREEEDDPDTHPDVASSRRLVEPVFQSAVELFFHL